MKLNTVMGFTASTLFCLSATAANFNSDVTLAELDEASVIELAGMNHNHGGNHAKKPGMGKGQRKGPCSKLKLSGEQKSTMKEVMFEFKKAQITKRAELRIARMEFRQALLAAGSSQASVDPKIQAIADITGELRSNRGIMLSTLVLDVFQPEQKRLGLRCVTKKLRNKKGKKGPGKHHRRHGRKGHQHGKKGHPGA